MSLQEYAVTLGGIETTMLLDDDDAQRYGDAARLLKGSTPANKSSKPKNKARSSSTAASASALVSDATDSEPLTDPPIFEPPVTEPPEPAPDEEPAPEPEYAKTIKGRR